MNEAKTTWALVVGIDDYDFPKLRRLAGAVADAVAAVRWLRSLGVPDEQILLHAAPSEASRVSLDALGLAYKGAREPEIWSSIAALRRVTGGTRLFVFLSGHGLYEAASGRLFLTQEAGVDDAWANLGMDEYGKLFRSMAFARQIVVLDGCQNYPYSETVRSTIQAAMHGGVTGYTPRAENAFVACYAAGQSQRALEIDGRGLFLRHLLDGLDLAAPCVDAVDLDFATGARTLDLRKLFALCRERVKREARLQTPPQRQEPDIAPEGPWQSETALPIVRLPEVQTAAVRVEVSPATAVPDLQRLRIFADEPLQWDLRRPPEAFPEDPVELPLESRLPLGLRGTARLSLRPGAPWDLANGQQSFRVVSDQVLVFEMSRRVVIRGYGTAEEDRLDGAADDGDEAGGGGRGGRGSVRSLSYGTDRELTLWRPESTGHEEEAEEPNLRLVLPPGGAAALAGLLADMPALWIGPPEETPHLPAWRGGAGALALAEIERSPLRRAEPGPIRVQIDLPWGRWSRVVSAPAAGALSVSLPATVEEPPLRVALRGELARQDGAFLLGVEGAAPPARLNTGSVTAALTSMTPGGAAWALGLEPVRGASPLTALAILELGGDSPASFPFLPGRPLAVDRSGGGLRVEPLSSVPLPAWDLLVSQGRLDALSPEDALALTGGRSPDWLLGLAGAYAIWANPASQDAERLAAVLLNLDRFVDARAVPDLDLLRVALGGRASRPNADGLAPLRSWAEARAVPIFRWGISCALRLLTPAADREPYAAWRRALAEIERTLSPISTWTAWTPS